MTCKGESKKMEKMEKKSGKKEVNEMGCKPKTPKGKPTPKK